MEFMIFNKWLSWSAVFAFALFVALRAGAVDIPLNTLRPADIFSMNPLVDVVPVATKIQLPTGGSHPALKLTFHSRITYDIPAGEASFGGVLYRADAAPIGAGEPSADDFYRVRVRFVIDARQAYETVLDVTMPPEQFAFPVTGAKKLTISVDQVSAAGSIYIVDANFSSKSVSSAESSHLLLPGIGYANLGSGVRQVAFRTYRPGETVPLQLEFSGTGTGGSVTITVSPNRGHTPVSLTVPVALHAGSTGALGNANWKVPSVLGPARLDLRASVNGKQVYLRTLNIAIAREVDVSKVSPSSTFGVHISSPGIPFLTDEAANIWGAKWARVFLRWEVIEFNPGQYDWRRIDELVDAYLAQNMEVMGVIGEKVPKWAGQSGPSLYDAFNKFAEAAVQHFRTKISHWDVYNEVDSKYYTNTGFDRNDPNADIDLLRREMQTVRRVSPSFKLICCSTGNSSWLRYDRRLYDNGLLNLMDIVSLHPYQSGPPELKDGAFNYPDMIAALRNLEHAYSANKPVWSTEANWLIGPQGTRGVTAPDVGEHGQSKYLVRVNLLSMALGVPYFAHSPFFYPFHPELLLDSVASYANMTYNFGTATNARMLNLPDGVYGVVADTQAGLVCALWTTRDSARADASGMSELQIQDLYGNPVSYDPASMPLSGDPVYISGRGTPRITVLQVAAAPKASPLPDLGTWKRAPNQTYEPIGSGLRVTSTPTTYGQLLKSPVISVSPNSCYRVALTVKMVRGGVAFVAVDPATSKNLGSSVFLFAVTGHDEYKPELTVRNASQSQVQILITGANPNGPEVSEFEVSNPQILHCYGDQIEH